MFIYYLRTRLLAVPTKKTINYDHFITSINSTETKTIFFAVITSRYYLLWFYEVAWKFQSLQGFTVYKVTHLSGITNKTRCFAILTEHGAVWHDTYSLTFTYKYNAEKFSHITLLRLWEPKIQPFFMFV